jgi:chemotaxis protein methyltransferase CheR
MSETLSDLEFEKFRTLIYEASGIHFSSTNRTILESRIRERLKTVNQTTASAYYEQLKKDPEELKLLLDAVTTNLTRFFRNTAHFDTLEQYVVPDLIKYKSPGGDKEIRVWSAGCSTGEEPYTIAMVLKDILPPDFRIKIVASDISLKSLMVGKEGFYPENRVQDIRKSI